MCWRSTADGAERAFSGGAYADVDTAASSRTVRGTSTGRRVGGMSVPGLVLVILVVVAIAVAVAGGLGLLPLGAIDASAPTGLGTTSGEATSATTMVGSIGVGHGTRTGVE